MPSHNIMVYHRTDKMDDRATPEVPLPADRTSSSTLDSGPLLARRMIFSLQKLKWRPLIEWRQRGMWPSLPLALTSIQARHLEPAGILIRTVLPDTALGTRCLRRILSRSLCFQVQPLTF